MSDDTISRKATIEAMEDVDWYHINKDGQLVHGANSKDHEPLYKAKDVYKVLNDMPSAQPERRWIPCKERLPENNDPVNVTWINHNPPGYYSDIKDERFTATAHYHNGHWYWYSCVTQDFLDEYGDCDIELVDEDVEIIAWMPLPEPYREGK